MRPIHWQERHIHWYRIAPELNTTLQKHKSTHHETCALSIELEREQPHLLLCTHLRFFHGAASRTDIYLYSQVRNALQICFGSPVGTSLRLEREFNLDRLDESSWALYLLPHFAPGQGDAGSGPLGQTAPCLSRCILNYFVQYCIVCLSSVTFIHIEQAFGKKKIITVF
jgi:hypothetical protein